MARTLAKKAVKKKAATPKAARVPKRISTATTGSLQRTTIHLDQAIIDLYIAAAEKLSKKLGSYVPPSSLIRRAVNDGAKTAGRDL